MEEVKLFWSFDSRMNLYGDNEYLYDLYRASMLRAKKLGYTVHFYGDNFAIEKFGDVIDIPFDITDKHFNIVDDLKTFVHEDQDLNCVTIDGDLILHDRLVFPDYETTHVYFDFPETKNDILKEENNIYNGYGDLKKMFEKYNTHYFFPSFNYDNDFACNTGLIKFNNQETKYLFLNQFKSLKNYFVGNIEPYENVNTEESNSKLRKIRFIIAQYHFGCLSATNNIPTIFLKQHNNYVHLFGNEKFYDHNKEMIYKIIENNG